jgi:hypothetical protein
LSSGVPAPFWILLSSVKVMSVNAASCTTSALAAVPISGTNQRLPASAAAALPAFTVMLITPKLANEAVICATSSTTVAVVPVPRRSVSARWPPAETPPATAPAAKQMVAGMLAPAVTNASPRAAIASPA